MTLSFDVIVLFMGILMRLTPLFLATNLTPFAYVPTMSRLVLLIALSALFTSVADFASISQPQNMWSLCQMLLMEFMVGVVFLIGLQVALAAVMSLAQVLDMQMGLGAAAVFNPTTKSAQPVIGNIFFWAMLLLFFTGNYHHLLLESFYGALFWLPVGSMQWGLTPTALVEFLTLEFLLAMMIMAPVIVGLFIFDAVVGVTSRTMPQMNVYFVTLPIKIFIGLLLLTLSVRFVAAPLVNLWQHAFEFIQQNTGAVGG